MKSKSIFLIAVSLGFGLIAAIGIRQVLGRSKADNTPKQQMVPVVVAAEDIDASVELTEEMVTIEEMPIQSAPEGAASSIEEIEGKVIRVRVGRRFAINLADLVDAKDAGTLAIPPGYKVIGIKVAADGHINGLLQPGDLVDVIGIFRQGPNGFPLAKTFLKKVRVFSVDGTLSQDITRDAKTRSTTVVSVLATQKQSEKLVLVQRMAELKIVMLGKDVAGEEVDYDKMAEDELNDTDTTLGDVLGNNNGSQGLSQLLQQSIAQTSASSGGDMEEFTMRVVTGGGIQTIRFGQDGQIKDSDDGANGTRAATPEGLLDDDYDDSADDVDSDLFIDESGNDSGE